MKARIKVKAFVVTGNYGVVTSTGFWSLVTDRDIARKGGLQEALAYYKRRELNSFYESLADSIILN